MADNIPAYAIRSKPPQLRLTSDLNPTRPISGAGKNANSARDKQVNALTAADLSARVRNLSAISQKIATAIAAIQATDQSISVITELVRLARVMVEHARQSGDVTVCATLADQFDTQLRQIEQHAGEATAKGISLLGGDGLTVTLSEGVGATLAVSSFNDPAVGDLAISRSRNNWATNADIEVAAAELKLALVVLRSRTQVLRSSLSTLQMRHDFTKATIDALQTALDNPAFIYCSDEGANLIALQARQHLSIAALTMAAQAGKNVLQLF